MARVFLAFPHCFAIVPEAIPSLMLASQRLRPNININGLSLLAHNFNSLWCNALNQRQEKDITHFAMHHADISAMPLWLDVLLAEMDRVKADVLSAVVPIKDPTGLTSTGIQDPNTLRMTRFTMEEVCRFPVTFDAAATGNAGKYLMVNTGLFVCDFTKQWVEEVCFEIKDRIVKTESGQFQAKVWPEDWNFSHWCACKGLRVFATRAVKVDHHGRTRYSNDKPWGTWKSDQGEATF